MSSLSGKRFHFIRHGIAHHNVAAAIHGPRIYREEQYLDARLTDDGKAQAMQLGQHVRKRIRPDVIIVSPLTRAIETAMLLQFSSPIVCVELCREATGVNYCDKRRSGEELMKEFPSVDFSGLTANEDVHFHPTKRETIAEVIERAKIFVEFLVKRNEKTIVVVSHGVFLEILLKHTVLVEMNHLYSPDLVNKPLSNCELRSVSTFSSDVEDYDNADTDNGVMDMQ
jgi:broad specificity phosphatase PhoE